MATLVKKLFVVVCFLGGGFTGNSQSNFYITSVKGTILVNRNAELKAGTTISPRDTLTFIDSISVAHAIDDRSMVFSFTPIYAQKNYTDVASFVAKLARKPRKNNNDFYVPTTPISDLTSIFGNEQFAIFSDVSTVELNTSKVVLSPNDIFVITYKIGNERVSRRIQHKGNLLVVERSKMLDERILASGKCSSIKCALYLFNPQSKKYSEISSFTLNVLNKDLLLNELQMVERYLESKRVDKSLAGSYLEGYFYDLYGRTFALPLREILEKLINR